MKTITLLAGALLLAGCSSDKGATLPSTTPSERPAVATLSASAASPPVSAVAAVSASPEPTAEPAPDPRSPPRAIDLHVDTAWQVKFKGRAPELTEGHATMVTLEKGQYGAVVYPIYIADYLHDSNPTVADAEEIYATLQTIFEKNPLLWPAPKGPTPKGKVTAYLAIEGAGAFAADITQIDRFIDRGIVFVGLVHARDNKLATSATGKDKKTGLTELGAALCERIYAGGALVDVSHMSDRAFDDLAAIAERVGAPIVATHSDARAVTNNPRNLTDAQLERIAKTGGVAGLNFHSTFLSASGTASLSDVVAHAKHMIEVAGVDHVAIGSDFDGGNPPADLADASYLPDLAAALRKAGVSAEDVHKIFSENAKRVLSWGAKRRATKK